jgi:hypothetical protein
MKWRRIRWVGHVVHMEEVRDTYVIFVEKLCLEDQGIHARIILKLTFYNCCCSMWTELRWLRIGLSNRILYR